MSTKPLDNKIKAMMDKMRAAEAGDGNDEQLSEDQIALGEKVTAVLNAMGISNRVLKAKLIAGTDVDLPEIDTSKIDAEDIPDEDKDAVIEGACRVLAELGYDLDEDDGEAAAAAGSKVCADDLSDDPEEAAEEVTAVISAFAVKHGDTAEGAKLLQARLKAATKVVDDITASYAKPARPAGRSGRAGRFGVRR